MRYILDCETSNLLTPALDYTALPYKLKQDFKVWCVVIRNIDTDCVVSLYSNKLTYNHLEEALKDCTELIFHNGINFDAPVLQLYGLLDYTVGYPGESSTLYGRDCILTDTLLWSKLLNADRINGHSLDSWGKRLGNHKGDFSDWTQFSQEMLDYCIQDTNLNKDIYFELLKEKGTWNFSQAYAMEAKLQDLTLKQEVFGFAFNKELAEKNLQELGNMMKEIASKVDPILPPKKLTQSALNLYTPPTKQFKKDGTLTVHMEKFIQKHNLQYVDWLNEVQYEGKTYSLPLTQPLKTVEVATTDDLDVVKGYLLGLGWKPSEVKERDLTKKADKTTRTHSELLDTIDRYVKQTLDSVYKDLRLELLEVEADFLKNHLLSRIDGTKPIYVPTSPKLTIGLEKEICPDLIKLGEKAEFAGSVVKYFTYRHRKNSIAGGVLDEDDEPTTGFLSAVREDGRIPTPADILGANTGRYRHKIVCNIPRVTSLYGYEMRALFGPGKGLYQLGFDFASLEARIMGHYVIGSPKKPYTNGIELAVALVAKKPLDIHTINAAKLGIPRDSAKSFSYASIYGAQPKKLAKMLGCSEAKAKQLFNAYWEAVPALKELKDSVENYWKSTGKKYILGLDGRRLVTRSQHSLINVLFQSGGAIVAKWSIIRIAQLLEQQGLLGNPFTDSIDMLKVWAMIAMHDEMQYACHPKLLDIKVYPDDETAKAAIIPECSTIGHGRKGSYIAFKTSPIDCIDKGIKQSCQELGTRTEMGFEYSIGPNWAECH